MLPYLPANYFCSAAQRWRAIAKSSVLVSDMITERNLLAQKWRRDFPRLRHCTLCGQLSLNNRSPPLKWFECLLSTPRLPTILLQVLLWDYNLYLPLITGDERVDAKCVGTTFMMYSQWLNNVKVNNNLFMHLGFIFRHFFNISGCVNIL